MIDRLVRPFVTVLLTVLILTAPSREFRADTPKVRMVQEVHATVSLSALDPAQPVDPKAEPSTLRVAENRSGKTRLDLRWPTAESATRVEIEARWGGTQPDGTHALIVHARVFREGEPVAHSERTVRFGDRETFSLFEAFRENDVPLTLVVNVTPETKTRFTRLASVGRAVAFDVEIVRVEEGQSVVVETNRLSTFVGESVAYEFKLPSSGHSARIELLPRRVIEGIVEVEAEVSGWLPREGGPHLVGESEKAIVSRNTRTTLSMVEGDPPTGWRFVVTPRF